MHVLGAKYKNLKIAPRGPLLVHYWNPTYVPENQNAEPGKVSFCHLPTINPGSQRTAFLKVHESTTPQALYELTLIAFLAATMSFFEPPQVPLRCLFEKIIKKSRFSDLFFLNQVIEFFNSLFR